ncbi:hypothetical protein ACFFX1_30880 [Dactylosporangium sucinum]|uniref:Uncharacterized protein n=1 Tax=Dactylosporangium sucinum TaxID=1424081 RepID=A0A917TV81_9ACTN|nr:hypothetical protein [Dactylosporangium sucinum]GGM39173.1 hypothetical protein GCM10007977_045750 [Dactylosporangium sucinum]
MITATDVLAVSEMSDGMFFGYIAALGISGAFLLVLAVQPFLKVSTGLRILNGLFGVGFLGYAFYLLFIFDGGTVQIFFYAFIAPILLLIQTIRQSKAQQNA